MGIWPAAATDSHVQRDENLSDVIETDGAKDT